MAKQEGPPLLLRALLLLEMIPQKYRKHAKAVAIVFVAIFCMAPGRILLSLWRLISTAFGVALGLGFGLGLAMHVFDHLQNMKRKFDAESASNKASTTTTTRKYPSLNSSVNRQPPAITLEDSSSYVSLMTLAGYPIEDKVLRGQLLRENSPFWQSQYQFTDVPIDKQYAPNVMQQDWPSLPPQVAIELGRFVEHVMRDFIAMWYYKIDKGCEYRDEREKRAEGILRDGKGRKDQGESMSDHAESNKNSKAKRKMVFSTAIHRRMPMMDKTYSLLSAVFGNLATRFEHVNIFSLVLLKWTSVLAQTFKVYRTLRKTAQEKNRTDYPTEIQITREFLLAGKLHRALTFGLDVPSLLFADASGHECGTGTDRPAEFPLQVLEERLMNTPMLEECQLDYNRVLAHRLVRALLPKADCNSPVAFTLVVEIFATYVLMPIMGLWIPAFLNGLIIMLMDKTSAQDQAKPDETRTTTSSSVTTPTTPSPASEEATATSTIAPKTTNVHDTKEQSDVATKERSEIDSSMGQQNLKVEERRSRTLSTTSSEAEESIQKAFTRNNQSVKDPVGSLILNIVMAALDELQKYVNLSDGRKDHRLSHEDSADWDDPACQEAILRLVMVVEAVLLHGRCMTRETIVETNSTNGSFDNMDEELTEMESEVSKLNEALPQLLMEMTSDMDLFESKIESLESKRPHFVDENSAIDFEPSTDEVSTLRTLLSTWLHTGNLSRAIILIVRGFSSFFSPFYSNDAFLANPENAKAFCGLIEVLNGVDIMVDTMVVLSSSRMDLEIASSNLYPSAETAGEGKVTDDNAESSGDGQTKRSAKKWSVVKSATGRVGFDETWSLDPLSQYGNMSTPRYLDFRKNSGFASSLREERERRIRSWETRKTSNSIHTVHRRRASAADVELHNEMHHLARIFHNGTNLITIRDAARKNTGNDEKVGLLTLETISNRRRIEVPDDDSSFLLKAQVSLFR